jgi:hypothetical protein
MLTVLINGSEAYSRVFPAVADIQLRLRGAPAWISRAHARGFSASLNRHDDAGGSAARAATLEAMIPIAATAAKSVTMPTTPNERLAIKRSSYRAG